MLRTLPTKLFPYLKYQAMDSPREAGIASFFDKGVPMRLIDLSQRIDSSIKSHPYAEPARLYRDRELSRDGFPNTRLEAGMHMGTHIDAPSHLTDDARMICDYPLERFAGTACCLDARGSALIEPEPARDSRIERGDIVLVLTGWGARFGFEGYFEGHPVLSPDFARALIERGIAMLGVDMPSPDAYPFAVHKAFFAEGIPIIENLLIPEELAGRRFELFAFPLNIEAEASMARVVARVI